MGSLTALDMIVLLLVGGGLALGALRGFVAEVLSLLAWVAVIPAIKFLHGPLSGMLEGRVGTRGGAAVLAFALIFLVVFIAGKLLSRYLGQMSRTSVVGPIDRVLGGGFGALKGLIGATLLFLLVNLVYDTAFGRRAERPEWMAQSRTYPLLNASSKAMVDFIDGRRRQGEPGGDGNAQDMKEPANQAGS
jgi:membrane protein required for colicin V production